MRAFRDAGVNRVSLGVQSLHDDELARLGRAARRRARARGGGRHPHGGGRQPQPRPDAVAAAAEPADWQATVDGLMRSRPIMPRSTSSSSTRTRRCERKWRARSGRSPPTTTRRTCTCGRWRGSTARATTSTNLERRAAGREVAPQPEVPGRTAPGSGLGAARTPRAGAVRWKNLAATAEYIARIAAGQDVQPRPPRAPGGRAARGRALHGLAATGGMDFDRWGAATA